MKCDGVLQRLRAPAAPRSPAARLWLLAALVVGTFYGALGMPRAFGTPYVVQDDARQHVFWMYRFQDPGLFPGDPIADYFEAVAPAGYAAVYRVASAAGVEPLLFSKLLPIALGLVTTAYAFGTCMRMFPVPAAAFLATVVLNQSLWPPDELVSGTPRAFAYPLFQAFVYYLTGPRPVAALVTVGLEGLFYPHIVIVSCVVLGLRLLRVESGRLRISHERAEWLLCAGGVVLGLLVILPFAAGTAPFGPIVTGHQARRMPEFLPGGRSEFFIPDAWAFWATEARSGLFPKFYESSLPLLAAVALPELMRCRSRFPLLRHVTGAVSLLPRIAAASLILFFAAHALLFRLHLPSRYMGYSLRVCLAPAAGIVLAGLLDAFLRPEDARGGAARGGGPGRFARSALAVAAVAGFLVYPAFLEQFRGLEYETGESPALYRFFASQPKDTLIASLSEEADYLPIFSRRPVLVSREHAIPYHTRYYGRFRERATALLHAQYSEAAGDMPELIRRYGIDFILVDREAFSPEYVRGGWIQQFEEAPRIAERLRQGTMPALARLVDRCSVFATENEVVLRADCVAAS